MHSASARSKIPSKFATPDATLSIKTHLIRVADSLSSSSQSHILGVIRGLDDLTELHHQDFTRLFDIQGSDSHLAIPGAASFHIPFPETKPLVHAYAQWLDANIKKFHTWFAHPKINTSGSMSSQILEAMLYLRAHAGKKDDAEFLKILETGWNNGWLRKSLFVAFMIHMLSTVAEAARARDPHLPAYDVLNLLVQRSLEAIFVPFLEPGSNIDDLMARWYQPLELNEYLKSRILDSEHLKALVDIDDLSKFSTAFRSADPAIRINTIIDHCAQQKTPWTPTKTASLLNYVHESAQATPASTGDIYAAVLQHITRMDDMKTPGFQDAMKRNIFLPLCQGLVDSAVTSREATFTLLNNVVSQIERAITMTPQSHFYKIFQNTGLAIASPSISIGTQSYPVSESFRSAFDVLKTKRSQLSLSATAFRDEAMARMEGCFAGTQLQPPSKL